MAMLKNEQAAKGDARTPDEATMEDMTGGGDADGLGVYDGSMGAQDLALPTLKIVYGVGKLAAEFNPGDLILSQGQSLNYKLTDKATPLQFILVRASEYYKEWLPFDETQSGTKVRTFKTVEEVGKAGGSLEWDNSVVPAKPPTFSQAMAAHVLIKKPEGFKDETCPYFGLELADGGLYALAKFYIDKTGFKPFKEGLTLAAATTLRGRSLIYGTFNFRMNITVTQRPGQPSRTKTLPAVTLAHINNEAMVASIRKELKGSAAARMLVAARMQQPLLTE